MIRISLTLDASKEHNRGEIICDNVNVFSVPHATRRFGALSLDNEVNDYTRHELECHSSK